MTTICVDVMGGDREPKVVLEGIAAALEADEDLVVLAHDLLDQEAVN